MSSPSEDKSGAASYVSVPMPNGATGKAEAGVKPTDKGTPVVFRNITYTVRAHGNRKEKIALLKDVSGCFSPSQMSALMGPSGSGKTTLLDVLAGRKTVGEREGAILFSAHEPSINFLRRFTGYVEQFDTLLDVLTVKEMLLYTAELKRPVGEARSQKEAVVDAYIDKLGLERCRDVRIGSPLSRGISGGQAKRTNIALAMVTQPRVLFLDEPTSGLDSYTANEVMVVVKALARDGVTVCATIHSPTPFCFDLFDRLLVLVRGEAVYHGPNGPAMLDYFRDGCGVAPPRTALSDGAIHNSADYLTDLVVGADREGRSGEYAAAFRSSSVKRDMDAVIERSATKDTLHLDKETEADLAVKRSTVTPLWKGLLTLIQFRTTRNYRNPEFLGPRIGDKLIFSFLVATLYLGIGDDFAPDNVINVAAVLFMWTTLPAFGAASYVPALTLEKPLFVRERADGLYRPITYLLSKFFDEFFITTIASIVFSVFVYFVVDLQCSFAIFWLVYLVTLTIGITLAYVVAILSPNMDVANAALPTYVVTLLFFAGFLFRFNDMPGYWQWYAYINFLRYAWGALVISQFRGKEHNGEPITIGGRPVLEYYGLDDYTAWEMLGYECLFFFVFFIAAWAALQFKRLAKR